MEQGCCSFVKRIKNRVYKTIHEYNYYGPYEECKILRYVSKLGPEFPQHIQCEGPYQLSYDYIEGMTLTGLLKKYVLSEKDKLRIFIQILNINKKLLDVGLELWDQGPNNFIIDDMFNVHVIDFGYVKNPYREQLSIIGDENEEDEEEYDDINIYNYNYESLRDMAFTMYEDDLIDEGIAEASYVFDLDKYIFFVKALIDNTNEDNNTDEDTESYDTDEATNDDTKSYEY